MSYVERRTLSELLLQYSLEPELEDVYVEGITDVLSYSKILNNSNVKFIEIDSIDFTELYESNSVIKRNNRLKVIELSKQLSNHFEDKKIKPICIADCDYDYFENVVVWNAFLKYTDYTSLEMYFFNEPTIESFLINILHGFPLSASNIINSISPVLEDLFFIRLTLKSHINEGFDDINFVDIKKSITISKATGDLQFDPLAHLRKILNSNSMVHTFDQLKAAFLSLKETKACNPRIQIIGHDFIRLFFLLIDKLKNSIKLNQQTFERSLAISVCEQTFGEMSLILFLQKKYNT